MPIKKQIGIHEAEISGGSMGRAMGRQQNIIYIFLLYHYWKNGSFTVVITLKIGKEFHFSGTQINIRSKKLNIMICILKITPKNHPPKKGPLPY